MKSIKQYLLLSAAKLLLFAVVFACASLVAHAACDDIRINNNTDDDITIQQVTFVLDGGGFEVEGAQTIPANCYIECPSGDNCMGPATTCPGYRYDANFWEVVIDGVAYQCCGVILLPNGVQMTITPCEITFD